MSEQMSYNQVVSLIEKLSTTRSSATLFIHTDKNRMVMLGMKEGEILYLAAGPKRGASAIPVLQEMTSAVVRIQQSGVDYHMEGIPSTREILNNLKSKAASASTARVPDVKPLPPISAATPGVSEDVKHARAVLTAVLTDYMGPVAPMICNAHLPASVSTLTRDSLRCVIQQMMQEIDDPAEAQRFYDQALNRLSAVRAGADANLAEAKVVLTKLLAEYMGPVAGMICSSHLPASGVGFTRESLRYAIQRIMQEIDSPTDAKIFIDRAYKLLKL